MKNKKLIALIISAATSCSSVYAATLPANEVGSYILAMNTMSPITAKYTIQYKQAIEQKCNTALGLKLFWMIKTSLASISTYRRFCIHGMM